MSAFTATFRTFDGGSRSVVIEAKSLEHATRAARRRAAGGGHGTFVGVEPAPADAVVAPTSSPWRSQMVSDVAAARAKRRAAGLVVLLACIASPVDAQPRVDDQLALARVAASECGFDCAADEMAAIATVLRGRSSSLSSGAHRYSARVFDVTRTDRRAYLAHLDASGREPASWPSIVVTASSSGGTSRARVHPPWSEFRTRWLALYELAGAVVRGQVRDRCAQPPRHWGGPMDHERATRNGLVPIDCGATRNTFYVRRSEVL